MIDTRNCAQRRTALNDAPAARRPDARTPARRRHAASISDAVIAAYIHDLRHAAAPKRQPA